MRSFFFLLVCSIVFLVTICTATISASEAAPSLAEQIKSWTSETHTLHQRIDKALSLMDDIDAVMLRHFTQLDMASVDRDPEHRSAVVQAADARAVRAWTDALQEEVKDSDDPAILEDRLSLQIRIERLGIFTELFANVAERNPEHSAEDIFRLLALNLYLPHRGYPPANQQIAFDLIQRLARSFPDPIDFAWPQENPEPAVPWKIELGPRAQFNLLNQIGPQRFRQVLQSVPPQALRWAVDYHGYPNALLENRLSVRIDHQRQRVVIEEILLNLRVNTPIEEKEGAAQE